MKRQIRYGVFESNSSSSHCILITKNDKLMTKDDMWHYGDSYDNYDEKETVYAYDNEWRIWSENLSFGRAPFEILSSVESKARYALASYCGEWSGYTDEEKVEKENEILDIINSVMPEIDSIDFDMKEIPIYEDIDGNELKEEEIFYDFDWSIDSPMYHFYKRDGLKHPAKKTDYIYEEPDIPGIDHQSADLLDTFLRVKNVSLKDFILNKKYIVVVDGDERCTWSEFKNNGLIDKSIILEEYGAWQTFLDNEKEEGEEDGADFGEE